MYIVMLSEDTRNDGYLTESKTSIIAIRNDESEAIELLDKATKLKHPDDKPIRGRYNTNGDIERVYGDIELEDRYWIENRSAHDFDEYCFFHHHE